MIDKGGTTPAESLNLRLVGHSDMNGNGVTMQLIARGDYLYVAHFHGPVGFSVVDVSNPRSPRVVKQVPALPGTRCLKLQAADDLLLVSNEQVGAAPARTGRHPPKRRFRPTRCSWISGD
jgi:hypothetical protein